MQYRVCYSVFYESADGRFEKTGLYRSGAFDRIETATGMVSVLDDDPNVIDPFIECTDNNGKDWRRYTVDDSDAE